MVEVRRLKTWTEVEIVAAGMGACIGPKRNNHDAAQLDFENYPNRVQYYAFPLTYRADGYLRAFYFAPDQSLYVDYTRPVGDYRCYEAARELAKLPDIKAVFIPQGLHFRSDQPERLPGGAKWLNVEEVSEGLAHKIFIKDELDLYKHPHSRVNLSLSGRVARVQQVLLERYFLEARARGLM